MIVTIDGPAGSGKSTAAKSLARRLGFEFLDTGAMYRAVGFALFRDGMEPIEGPRLHEWLNSLRLEAPPGIVRLDGGDISGLIRTPEISAIASRVAVLPSVRAFLGPIQRQSAQGRDVVCEGRDQGTVVFPDAGCKFFLVADPRERARRRHHELVARGRDVTFEKVLADQEERDRRDAGRDLAPMVPAADAVVLDTTHLTLDDVVARMETEVRRCQGSSPPRSTSSPRESAGSS
ncbi:MAG TPA: (d)CMP kinase [Gemmataceae bacterium]|nr:(d)CMP kinase [Gemmataceae bacterium]